MLMKKFLLSLAVAMTAMFAAAQTKTYTDNLAINMDGTDMAPQQSSIIVKQENNGTYTLSLNNFIIHDSGMDMPVGNIVVNNISVTTDKGIKAFKVEQNITIQPGETENDWIGPYLGELPISISGKMTEGSLYCSIGINMNGSIINVVFGTDINKTFSYDEDLIVTIDGESMEPQRTTIHVDEIANGTCTLALNNFELPDMPIGNIILRGITTTAENDVRKFATEQTIVITNGDDDNVGWIGPMLGELPVSISGKMTGYKLYCNIDIEMGQTINVKFGNENLTGIENIAGEQNTKVIFDITGRRIDTVTAPGIYIVNGKKVLVK